MASGQRAVPVNVRPFYYFLRVRTLACFLSCALVATPWVARAQDGGVDAPRAVRLLPGQSLNYPTLALNEPAEVAVDAELKRLQSLERAHKAESWTGVLITGGVVGVLLGIAAGVVIGYAIPRK